MTRWLFASLAVLVSLAACRESRPARDASGGERPNGGKARMAAMEGMPGADASAFWDSVRAHVDSVVWLEPNQLVFVRGVHDSLARRALEQMDREMRAMSTAAGGAWDALADSVRRDLTVLDGLVGEDFVLRLRAHAGRLRRLIAMYERMTGTMEGM